DSRHRTGPRLRPYSPAFPKPIRNSGQVVVYHSPRAEGRLGSDLDGIGTAQHPQLGHEAVGRVDAELVGQPQQFARLSRVAQLDEHRRRSLMLAPHAPYIIAALW